VGDYRSFPALGDYVLRVTSEASAARMANEPTGLDAEEARATAAKCQEAAKLATSVEQRVMLWDMVVIWERIARSLESDNQSVRLG
jgi:hypothetical protein